MCAAIVFTEIEPPDQGLRFEQFVESLLRALGWTIVAGVGKGPDGGRDIIAEITESTATERRRNRRFVIQCKHNAISGRSVSPRDLGNLSLMPEKHNCDGWLLVMSTQLTADALNDIDAARRSAPGADFDYWDYGRLRDRLMREECHEVFAEYLPTSYAHFAHILIPSPAEIRSLVNAWLAVCESRGDLFSLDNDSDTSLTGFFAKHGQKLRDLRALLADQPLHNEFMNLWQSKLVRGEEKASGVVLLNGLRRLHQLRGKGLSEEARHGVLLAEVSAMYEYRDLQRRYWRGSTVFSGIAASWTTVRASNFPPIFLEVMLIFFCPERGHAASGLVRLGDNGPERFISSHTIESRLRVKRPYEFALKMDAGSDPINIVTIAFSEFPGQWTEWI